MFWTWFVAQAADGDGDGVDDAVDRCPSIPDPTQSATFAAPVALPLPPTHDAVRALAVAPDPVTLLGVTAAPGTTTHTRWTASSGGFTVAPDGALRGTPAQLALGDVDLDGRTDRLTMGSQAYVAYGVPWGFAPDGWAEWVDGTGSGITTAAGQVLYAHHDADYIGGDLVEWTDVFAVVPGALEAVVWTYDAMDAELHAADVDGDGAVDVVLHDGWTGEVRWLAATPPTWADAGPLAVDVDRVAVGDLDGDGADEVVTLGARGVEVLAGAPPVVTALADPGRTVAALTLGDLDRDGDLDVVGTGPDGTVWWARRPDGAFDAAVAVSDDPGLHVVAADLDASGTTDLAVSDGAGVALLAGDGPADRDADGRCDADDACPLEAGPCGPDTDADGLSDAREARDGTDPGAADSDADGLTDLDEVVLGTGALDPDSDADGVDDGGDACPLAPDDGACSCPAAPDPADDGDGDAIADACDPCPTADAPPTAAWSWLQLDNNTRGGAVGDLDGDGDEDLFTEEGAYENDGAAFVSHGPGEFVWAPLVADLDGDGAADVVDLTWLGVTWNRNLGGFAFAPEEVLVAGGWTDAARMVVAAPTDPAEPELWLADGTRLSRVANAGLATLSTTVAWTYPAPVAHHDLAATDVDGDGDGDVVLALDDQGVVLLRADGGAFTPIALSARRAVEVEAGDVDGDGDVDVVVGAAAGEVAWLEATPGGWVDHLVVDDVTVLDTLVLADGDGDGDPDLWLGERGRLRRLRNDDGVWISAGEDRRVPDVWSVRPVRFAAETAHHALVGVGASLQLFTDLAAPDHDADGVCDALEADADGDGLDAAAEAGASTDPTLPDTDGDGLRDAEDPAPLDADRDGDGLRDGVDAAPDDADLDDDGLPDGADRDPTDPDIDGDGILDGADPCDAEPDRDGDGACDADDACPDAVGDPGADADGDGIGDACDDCAAPDPGQGRPFGPPRRWGAGAVGLATGDRDADGRAELAFADGAAFGWWGRDGAVQASHPWPARAVAPGDVDGDGRDELVAWVRDDVLLADGSQVALLAEVPGIAALTVADLDGDGGDEVIASTADALVALTRPAWVPVALGAPGAPLAAGDLDDDGDDEVVVGGAELRRVDGDGAVQVLDAGGAVAVATLDVDGDGAEDVVAARADGTLRWFAGAAATALDPAVPGAVALAVGDGDGDGRDDLWAGPDADGRWWWFRAELAGLAAGEPSDPVGGVGAAVVDVDGLGGDDLVVATAPDTLALRADVPCAAAHTGDTGLPAHTGLSAHTGAPGTEPDPSGGERPDRPGDDGRCGCGTTRGAGLGALLAALGAARRRRPTPGR